MSRHPVTFMPSGDTVWVDEGMTVLQAARRADVTIHASCGGRGVCGECGVRIVAGALGEVDPEERAGLSRAPAGVRLACRAHVVGAVTVRPLIAAPRPIATHQGSDGGLLVVGVDLGTTNVSAVAVEQSTGREVGRATVRNRQAAFGSDVLSRLSAALGGAAPELALAARRTVSEAVAAAAGDFVTDVGRVVVAGNSAMTALLAGVEVGGLAVAPFAAPPVPEALDGAVFDGLPADAEIRLVPPISSFVGGDVLAGLAAVGAASREDAVLLVDVGTNAEVALWHRGTLTVTSAAAGPAFEGVRGLTGSGLVAAVARLRREGLVSTDGLLDGASAHVQADADGVRYVTLEGPDDVTLTQLDLRAFQLAKAAVSVAFDAVLEARHVKPKKLASVWFAGAFGGALDPADLVELGVIPAAVVGVLSTPGNTSLDGALGMAFEDGFGSTSGLLASVRHVDLAADPTFSERLMRAVELAPRR